MPLDFELLHNFTGTANWYRHSVSPTILYTDGAKYVADSAGAYWLLDYIALAQCSAAAVREEAFQVWRLDVKGGGAALSCEDGNGRTILTLTVPVTDFPEPGIELWCTNKTILLPTEY